MLQSLLKYDSIAIQCHNIPDADSLAAGFGLYRYFKSHGKSPIFFYGGPPVTKPNLVGMIDKLKIPVQNEAQRTTWDGLLITVDCQYGMGNVAKVTAPHIVVIDHHIQEATLPEICDLRPWLGSCATLVWDLLVKENFSIDTYLATALLYGLFMDTNGFSELNHPLDRDMWENLVVDSDIFKMLKLSNLSLSDLFQTSTSLNQLNVVSEDLRLAVIPAPPCDPNILGVISDLAMQVDTIDTVVAYSPLPNEDVKFSVRTTTREVKANDLAAWLAQDLGSGGGHSEKAGGYIAYSKFKEKYGQQKFLDFCNNRLHEYYEKFTIIDCLQPTKDKNWLDYSRLRQYRKLSIKQGFIETSDIFGANVSLHVRTLEGDITIQSHENTLLMIGISGEVYPIQRDVFEKIYTLVEESYEPDFQYTPSVLNIHTGRRISLIQHSKVCRSAGSSCIQVMPLQDGEYFKIFTRWDQKNYYSGKPGDWLAVRADDDVYIINKDIFHKTYARDFTGEDISTLPHACKVQKHDEAKQVFWAVHVQETFSVIAQEDGAVCMGQSGDWLVQYSAQEYSILNAADFAKEYTLK